MHLEQVAVILKEHYVTILHHFFYWPHVSGPENHQTFLWVMYLSC